MQNKTNHKSGEDQYWATLQEDEFLDALHYRIGQYYDFLQQSGIYRLWKRSFIAYYGGDMNSEGNIFDSSMLTKGGKLGQITKVKINSYRNLVKHSVNLATANKTSLTCVASNTDYKSQAQTVLGTSLLDYYMNVAQVSRNLRNATEVACLTGEGWIHAPWEPKKGNIYEIVNGKPKYEGDLDVSNHTGLDIIRDTSLRTTKHPWRCIRRFKNKWDLVAKYPQFRDEILSESSYDYEGFDSFRFEVTKGIENDQSELIPEYIFYHDKTEAMPDGRLVIASKNVIFFDGKLPYEKMPLMTILPDVLHESCFGYSPFNDLLGIQQAKDNILSAITSNNMTFANQFIWKRKNDNFSVKNIEGGLKLLESAEMPQPLQLTASSPEAYNLHQLYETAMEMLSGISSTVRGNPQANLKSGAALALVVAQSIQFGSALEESYSEILEDTGTTIIQHLQAFADTPRVAYIVGESNRPFMKEYKKADIADIKRVTVQQTNALSKTISGRLEIANQVMQMPPEQAKVYMSILNTGQLPAEWQTHNSVMNIKAENENLQNGRPVRAVVTENHATHIQHHMEVVENPEAKNDNDLMTRTLEHIQEHLNLWRAMGADLLMITGQNPPPPPGMGTVMDQNAAGLQPPQDMAAQMPQAAVPQGMPQMQAPMPVQGAEQAQQPNMPGMPAGTPPQTQAAYQQFLGKI